MKKKILLFVSLVLIAVQGWATTVDSLDTQSTGSGIKRLNDVHLIDFSDSAIGDATKFKYDNILDGTNLILPSAVAVGTTAYKIIKTGYNIYKYFEDRKEYMHFALGPKNTEVIVGEEYEFDLIAYQGFIESPITIEMFDSSGGAFEFDDVTIMPEEVTDGINYWRRMKIKFRAPGPNTYTAHFRIRGSEKVKEDLVLTCTAVLEHKNQTIYVKPSTQLHFQRPVGSSQTNSIIVTAKGLTGQLNIEKTRYYVSDMSHFFDDEMFTIDKTSISAEEAARGATINVTYNPTAEGIHEAKILISGDGTTPKVISLFGKATNDYTLSENGNPIWFLTFGPLQVEDSFSKTFTVTGPGPIFVETDWADGHTYDEYSMYSLVGRDNFTAEESAQGAEVTVNYNPTAAGTHIAKVNIRDKNGVLKKELYLMGDALSSEIIVDKHDLTLINDLLYTPVIDKIKVTGIDLTGDLSMKLEDETGMFSIVDPNPPVIAAENAHKGVYVSIKYEPTELGPHEAVIKISGGSAKDTEVRLKGTTDPPAITVTPSSYDFETVNLGDSKPQTFTVKGTNLTERISITPMETIGGDYSFTPEFLPATGGDVTITYKPNNTGSTGAVFTLSSGDVSTTIDVVGTCVIPPTIIRDKTSLDFGTIPSNQTVDRELKISGINLTGDLTLSSSSTLYTVTPRRITATEANNGKTVTVTYKPTASGNHNAYLTISGGGADSVSVDLTGKCVNPTITVNKTSLDFTPIEAGKTAKQTIIVAGSDLAGSISVKLEETVSGQFSINKETLPASGGSVVVTYHPTEGGSHGGCVRISATGATAVPVTVSGSARELSVSKTSLNFGTIKKTDAPPKQKFTVYGKNLTGNVTLTSSNSRFTVSPASITPEEAKAGKEVTVTYTPTTGGTHSGKIIVSASGVTSDTVSVSGKCAAISPNPTSYDFGNVAVGKPVTKEITITGTNLTSAMSITLAETEGGQYSINKTTLPASGGTVIVTFKPTDAKSFGASLNISGGSAAAVSVCLSGKGVTPTITINKSTLTFTGSSITSDYVKVTGTNLDDVISLTVTGSTNFTVSPSTISISDAADGKQVKVTCNPKNATSAEATLKISSPYASTKYVTLKYSRGSSGGGEVQVSAVQPEGGDEDTNNEFTNGGSLETTMNSTTDVNELVMNSKIYSEGLNIIIESPVEQNAIISDISGRARSVNLQAGRNEIPVNASGIYIVRIREKTTKLMLK